MIGVGPARLKERSRSLGDAKCLASRFGTLGKPSPEKGRWVRKSFVAAILRGGLSAREVRERSFRKRVSFTGRAPSEAVCPMNHRPGWDRNDLYLCLAWQDWGPGDDWAACLCRQKHPAKPKDGSRTAKSERCVFLGRGRIEPSTGSPDSETPDTQAECRAAVGAESGCLTKTNVRGRLEESRRACRLTATDPARASAARRSRC